MKRTRTRDLLAPTGATAWRAALLLAAAILAAAADAWAAEFSLFPDSAAVGPRFYAREDALGEAGFRILDLEGSYPWSAGGGPGPLADSEILRAAMLAQGPATPAVAAVAPPTKLFTTPTIVATAGTLLLGSVYAMSGGWKYGFNSFHFTDEKWFESSTYSGGADKSSHVVVSSGLSRFLYEVYVAQGHSPDQSFALAFSVSILTGFIVEIGDGVTVYGFSAQDLAADVLGTAAGLLINRNHLQDLLGIRLGKVSTDIPDQVIGNSEPSLGTGYSNEIFVADVKFLGLGDRLHLSPGLARYFLFSVAYFTKGFGYEPPIPGRYQNVGFELGLNVPEVLTAVGVKETTWWGKALLAAFNFFRIPFTQVGVYYDLTNHKWYGPGAPYGYNPH